MPNLRADDVLVWAVRAGHIYFILWTLSTSINIAIKRMTGLHPLREIFHISGWIRLIGSCMELLNWYWCWLFIWSCVIWNNWNSEPITIVLMVAPCQALHSSTAGARWWRSYQGNNGLDSNFTTLHAYYDHNHFQPNSIAVTCCLLHVLLFIMIKVFLKAILKLLIKSSTLPFQNS